MTNAPGRFVPAASVRTHFEPSRVLPARGAPVPAATPSDAPAAEPPLDLEALRREAYEAGAAAARAERDAAEAARVDAAVAALEDAAARIRGAAGDYLRENRRAALELGLAIAEHVLGGPPGASVDALAALVDRGLALLDETQPVVVRVAPEAADALVQALAARGRAPESFRIEADPEVARGEARLAGSTQGLTVKLDEALARVRAELAGASAVEESQP